jgi:hypothetical protein
MVAPGLHERSRSFRSVERSGGKSLIRRVSKTKTRDGLKVFQKKSGMSVRYAPLGFMALAALWANASVAGEGAPGTAAPTGPASGPQSPTQPAPNELAPPEVRRGRVEGRPALQMSSDFGSPALAIASYRPVGDVEARGVRVDPFTIRAAAITAIGYDDNVTLAQNVKTSSMFVSFTPSIIAGLEGATERYYAVYRGNYGKYTSSSLDNYDDHNLSLIAANEWTTRFRTQASYDFLRGHNPRGFTVTAVTQPEQWNYQSLQGAVSYGAEGAQGRVEGAAAWNSRHYITNQAVNASRDYDQAVVGGTFFYRVAPKTRALVQVVYADITHDHAPALDSTEVRYAVGATWQALAKTEGSLRVGVVTKDFSDPTLPDFTGPTVEGAVTWSPATFSVVNLAARRTISETAEINSTFSVSTAFSVNWTHDWDERWRSAVTYVHDLESLRGISREDTYNNAAVRLSYALRRWLRVGAELRHDQRDSSFPGIDYKRNLMLVTLETAL